MIYGLTHQEVEERKILGKQNIAKDIHRRSYVTIVRENIFTFINILLAIISMLLVYFGRLSDGIIYFWVALINIVVSMAQEIHAQMKLDSISKQLAPTAQVIREGKEMTISSDEVVIDDCIIVRSGEVVVADAVLLEGVLECDESILTGESKEIAKHTGDELLSGSLIMNGQGVCRVVRVGNATISSKISNTARAHKKFITPIQREVNVTIRMLVAVCSILGVMAIMYTQIQQTPLDSSIQIAAVIVGVIPNSLFAMINVAYALGGVAVLQRGALVQKLNSIESLSHVDVLCLDKTGTLTTKQLELEEVVYIEQSHKMVLLSLLLHTLDFIPDKNATMLALESYLHTHATPQLTHTFTNQAVEVIPFHSRYKFSGVLFDDNTSLLMGAPEVFLAHIATTEFEYMTRVQKQVHSYQVQGFRVLAVCINQSVNTLYDAQGNPKIPTQHMKISALLVFSDTVRSHVQETIAQFMNAGVEIKIISGDSPETVYALTKQMNLFPEQVSVVNGFDITEESIDDDAKYGTIFGRITPDQKESLIASLQRQGKYVAMIGDGVNDVMSLKTANLGIAMESGAHTTKSVSDIVLLKDSFESLPVAVVEGQKIRNGLINIFKLYVSRIVYLVFLYIAVFTVDLPFPFSVKHSSLVAFIAAGIPALALSIWTHQGKSSKNNTLYQSVGSFVIPIGIITGLVSAILLFFLTIIQHDVTALNAITASSFIESYVLLITPIQTALVLFFVIISQIIVIYIVPPHHFFAVSSRYVNDIRPTILSCILLVIYGALYSLFEPFRNFWGITTLSPLYVTITLMSVILWWVTVHITFKYKLCERFIDTYSSTT